MRGKSCSPTTATARSPKPTQPPIPPGWCPGWTWNRADWNGFAAPGNPEGYRTGAAITYAEGLRGDLLIITVSGETNTHIEITEGLVDRLIELGKRFDYFVFATSCHKRPPILK